MRIFIICGEESAPEKVLQDKDTTRSFVHVNSKIYCIQKAQKSGYCKLFFFLQKKSEPLKLQLTFFKKAFIPYPSNLLFL